MLAYDDRRTVDALRQLLHQAENPERPIALWIGAGASAWSNYPLWGALAADMHRDFSRFNGTYPKQKCVDLLQSQAFPAIFQICRDLDRQRYFRLLAQAFAAHPATPVYERFINTLRELVPLQIITTNVDELLEQHLPTATLIQQSDFERCVTMLHTRTSFIAKLHGSISSINSTVFTTQDYEELTKNESYLTLTSHLFRTCTVVFIGTSLADNYLIDLLSKNAAVMSLFGEGPHFLVGTNFLASWPTTIRLIKYQPDQQTGHRTPLQVIEAIRDAQARPQERSSQLSTASLQSGNLISDLYPPGTWTSSITTRLDGNGKIGKILVRGYGFTKAELPPKATAFHDIVVSLVCFDITYVPLESLSRVLSIIGETYFFQLLQENALKFIRWDAEEGVAYSDDDAAIGGGLQTFQIRKPDETSLSVRELMLEQVRPRNPSDDRAEVMLKSVEKATILVDNNDCAPTAETTTSLLLFPNLRRLLGMSEGTPLPGIPRWLAFPVLRLAKLERIGGTCAHLGIASTKLPYGAGALAAAAFAATRGILAADDVASYVLRGRFNISLDPLMDQERTIIKAVLEFRDSERGIKLRESVLSNLATNPGAELIAAIDAGLRNIVPTDLLERSHQEIGLWLPEALKTRPAPAWAEQRGIRLVHIQPGKPTQNSFIESFNGRFRDECLNASWFENLADARRKIEAWREDYNQRRPHSSLAYRTPAEFARRWSPSPSTTVVEQAGESVKDAPGLRAARESLTDSPACSKASDTRMKGKSEGVMI